MPQTLVLEDVVASAMDVALQNVWTAMPATVVSYDSTLQRANVQIGVKIGNVREDGERAAVTVAVINAVPVLHAGGGGFREVYPIRKGDTVLVVFTTRSIDTWLAKGGLVDPHFDHHHDLSDAVAIAGLRDFAHPLVNAPTDRASIGYDTGATIEFHQNEIRIGSNIGTQPTLKATTFLSELNTLLAAIATEVGVSGTPATAAAAGTAITAAIGVFNTALPGAITTVAKVI